MNRKPPIMRGDACPFYNLFHGLVYCATCGKSMQLRYEKKGRTDIDRKTKKKREPIDKAFYTCQTYNRLGCKVCSSHKIEARDLYDLVLNDIQELAEQAIRDKDGFYRRISTNLALQYAVDSGELHDEYNQLLERNQEIDDTFLSLYMDKTKGVITEQRFLKLTAVLEQEQDGNRRRMEELSLLLNQTDSREQDIQAFLKEIRRYAAIRELDEVLLNRLIQKITIGEVRKVDGEKVQEVRIFYNFVGALPDKAAI